MYVFSVCPRNITNIYLTAAGLTGFAIFVSVSGIVLSLFMLLVPVFYEKYDKFIRLARALKEVRVAFILTGAGATASFLIASVFTCLIDIVA
jgi:hypothetical protein